MNVEQVVKRVGEIDAQIERLQDEREETLRDIERAAFTIAKATGGIVTRTTEVARFSHKGDYDVIHFDMYDNYDGEIGSGFACSYADLLDPDAAVERISRERKAQKQQALRARIERTQAQLAELQAEEGT